MVERMNLSKTTVAALKPRAKCPDKASKAYDVFDRTLVGFHVRVHPSGVKSFRLKYVGEEGRQKTLTLGKLSDTFTVDQARRAASPARLKVEQGGDPLADAARAEVAAAEERRRAISVAALVDRWLEEGRDSNPTKRASSWSKDTSLLRRHIVPLLGDIKARNLTRDDIEKAQRAIVAGKTALDEKTGWRGRARVTGGPGAARRAIASLSSCLNWALDRSIITANPAVRVKKPAQGKRERYLSEVEAGQLLDTLAEMERGRALQSVFGDMIRVLLLTGARRNEIMELRWSEVDLERGLISLPPERSKTGAKHIPLSAPAAAIIAARPRSERFVFPSPTRPEKPAVGLPKAWSRVRTRANLEGVRIHDLRHSYASFAAAGGASLHLIGKALGHAQAGTTHRYAHLGTDPVKDMAERIGAKIMGTQTKTSEHETADIVPLPTKISR